MENNNALDFAISSKDGVKLQIGTLGNGCILSGLTENSTLITGVQKQKGNIEHYLWF